MTNDVIIKLCEKYSITNYQINDDFSIDVNGHIDFFISDMSNIPIKFNRVNGDFMCSLNYLTSLENVPNHVSGDFSCSSNLITSLDFAPTYIGGIFKLYFNDVELSDIALYIIKTNKSVSEIRCDYNTDQIMTEIRKQTLVLLIK